MKRTTAGNNAEAPQMHQKQIFRVFLETRQMNFWLGQIVETNNMHRILILSPTDGKRTCLIYG